MDDLDRMFRRLVQNIRSGSPEYLTHPFEVAELYQTLIPYRHNRRELEIETNQDYEVALCRLLSGERGYLVVDDVLAESMRQELATPNPNTALFREFAASRVSLAPAAARRWEEVGADSSAASAPPSPATSIPSPPASSWALGRTASTTTLSAPSADRVAAAPRTNASAAVGASEDACRYCGATLPSGREAKFCPHCGQNLTIQRCPACGTELELNWKFCITCGRGVATS